MVYMSHKKGIGLCIVVMFLCISCFGVKAYAPSFQRDMRQITNPYDDFTNLTKIQLKGVCYDFDEIIGEMDALNMLRVQFERIGLPTFPSVREYSRLFALNSERMKRAKKDVLVMHPGPINRGLELESEIADGPNSTILRQVTNGLTIRMAVLFLVNQATADKKKA